LLHPDCEDGQKLLDAYVRALSNVETIRRSNGGYELKTVQYICDALILARRRYWTHVRKHRCRKSEASSVRRVGEVSSHPDNPLPKRAT
jgi:hypothetical protein